MQLSDEARPFPNHPIALSGGNVVGGGLGGGLGAPGLSLGNGNGLGGGYGPVSGGFDAPVSRGPIGGTAAPGPIGGGSLAPIGSGPIGGGSLAPVGAPIGAPMQQQQPAPVPQVQAPTAASAAVGSVGGGASNAASSEPSGPITYAQRMKSGIAAAPALAKSGGSGSYAAAGTGSGAAPRPVAVTAAATAAAQSPEALLAMLTSLTAGAEGVGVLGTSPAAASGYVLRPQESAAWSQRLAPLVTNIQGVLATVGAQRFCQMIDRVANPNDWSLASEVSGGLARGARLEVVQDGEIAAAIEVGEAVQAESSCGP